MTDLPRLIKVHRVDSLCAARGIITPIGLAAVKSLTNQASLAPSEIKLPCLSRPYQSAQSARSVSFHGAKRFCSFSTAPLRITPSSERKITGTKNLSVANALE